MQNKDQNGGYNTKYTNDTPNSNRPLMKYGEGVKIRPFSVRTKVQKQKLNRLINLAKMGSKDGYQSKWYMVAPNSDNPFNNVEEGLKMSYFTVYNMPQNSLHIGQKYYTRNRHTREVKKQVQRGGLKQWEALNQTCKMAQNKPIFS